MRKLIIVLAAAAWCAAAQAEPPSDESIATLLQAARSERNIEVVHAYLGNAIRPTGAAFVDRMPAVLQKTQALMQARIGPLTEKMNAAVAQAVQELQEAGAKPRTSGM